MLGLNLLFICSTKTNQNGNNLLIICTHIKKVISGLIIIVWALIQWLILWELALLNIINSYGFNTAVQTADWILMADFKFIL